MTAKPPTGQITRLLHELGGGDKDALNELMPLVYRELRIMADRVLRRERRDHTLNSTGLVHEAYLRLVDQRSANWQHRAQFLGVAARMMRRILVDHARKHGAAKRGGGRGRITLDYGAVAAGERPIDLEALDEAMARLAGFDAQQAQVVELRFFGGLTIEETAEVIGISPATVKREWTIAKAWLRREIDGEDAEQ